MTPTPGRGEGLTTEPIAWCVPAQRVEDHRGGGDDVPDGVPLHGAGGIAEWSPGPSHEERRSPEREGRELPGQPTRPAGPDT